MPSIIHPKRLPLFVSLGGFDGPEGRSPGALGNQETAFSQCDFSNNSRSPLSSIHLRTSRPYLVSTASAAIRPTMFPNSPTANGSQPTTASNTKCA